MALLTPPPIAPQRGDKSTFSIRLDAFITWIVTFVAQLLALVSSLNTLAAGGAYSIPYLIDLTSTADSDPTAGLLRFNAATQNAATTIYLDLLGSDGIDYTAILDQLDASSSTVKCSLRMVKMGDPTKFLTFSVTARTAASGYRKLTLVATGGSAASPFGQGDGVQLQFSRTGDKGDVGTVAQIFHAREEQTSGTYGVTPSASTSFVYPRLGMNTVKQNDFGATLSGGRFTLPVGKYLIRARTTLLGNLPAQSSNTHSTLVGNVTDGTVVMIGSAAPGVNPQTATSGTIFAPAEAVGYVVIASGSKQFEVRTFFTGTVSSGGIPASTGGYNVEVYTEVIVEKIG